MNYNKLLTSMIAGCLFASCSSDNEIMPQQETTTATFTIGLDAQTRAAQTLDLTAYDARMYLYEGTDEADGTVSYSYKTEYNISANTLTIDGLTTKTKYKAVFLAKPKAQEPSLPDFTELDTKPTYTAATLTYINGNEDETDKHIFRSILSFTASASTGAQSTVLTRQNGALEVRIKNIEGMNSVKLHAKGHTTMYLHDGTGGQVITSGEGVALSKTVTDGLTASEVRIRINLLPQEDITDTAGSDYYLEITTSDGTTKYPIKSDQTTIPIYPNQVTWLTLGSGTGDFDVSFSGNINLEDEEWDGWSDQY